MALTRHRCAVLALFIPSAQRVVPQAAMHQSSGFARPLRGRVTTLGSKPARPRAMVSKLVMCVHLEPATCVFTLHGSSRIPRSPGSCSPATNPDRCYLITHPRPLLVSEQSLHGNTLVFLRYDHVHAAGSSPSSIVSSSCPFPLSSRTNYGLLSGSILLNHSVQCLGSRRSSCDSATPMTSRVVLAIYASRRAGYRMISSCHRSRFLVFRV